MLKDLQPSNVNVDHSSGDRAAKLWFLISVLWFPFFAAFGFILAIKFFLPDFLGDASWLTFGVVRPAHTNGVLFGFVSSGLIGAMLWIVPRLCATSLYRPRLAILAAVLWNGAIVGGIIWILLGGSQGREYAELPWAIDVAVMATLLLLAYIVFGTILKRKEKKLYVSLWYYMGTLLWFPIVYLIGNVMWHPSSGALNGIQDAIFNWYYGHNVLGLWFTTLGIPVWYYFVPKLINRPLYSHLLSLIAFFTIAFFYTGVGAHHLLQAPIPEWLKTIAVIMSILMIVPVITFATNILLTLRGSWHKVLSNIPLAFMMAGFFMYVLASFQGSFQALRDTNLFTHFSQWPVGHAHLALLGGFGFLAVGLAYYLVPRILQFRVFSQQIMKLSFWMAFVGFFFFFLAMTVAGLVANSDWWVHINVIETLVTLKVHFIWRAMAGGVVVLAAFVFAYNIIMTFIRSRHPHEEVEHEPIEAKTDKEHSKFMRRSQEAINVPLITIGGMVVFVIMTFMVVAMPYMFTVDEPSDRAHVLSAEELQGESLYRANGCFYCHNQFVRPQDWAMGVASLGGDFYYSIPNFLGTERTGPSLGQIGGKRPTEWHIQHHEDPRSVSPSSIMPPFGFLSEGDLTALAAYVQNLGSEDLNPNAFQPPVPVEYQGKSNPNMPTMMQVMQNYNAENQTFSGSDSLAATWTSVFEEGKKLYIQKCLSCHGCSGNGQGPYARQVLTRPANLHERLINYPDPDAPFHFWRVSAGVPGTAMPPWGLSLDEDTIWKINTYEMSFINGALRTVSGDISDEEGDRFNAETGITPPIAGTREQYEMGKQLYELYCAQCHGTDGHGDGPASILTPGGYITPEPANFEESGSDFTNYGRYVWKVREGVETTNMPPWRYALSDDEIFRLIFYIQGFSTAEDYNTKWAILYTDDFARHLKEQ
jgi:cbb3-type cytochrome c oxidase subunit I/cbb3-type cytochrome c oxidase subunit II